MPEPETIETDNYYVTYRIPALTGDKLHKVGPYHFLDVAGHMQDIRGYEGVTDVAYEIVIKPL